MSDPTQRSIDDLRAMITALQAQVQQSTQNPTQGQAVTFALNPSTASDTIIDMN